MVAGITPSADVASGAEQEVLVGSGRCRNIGSMSRQQSRTPQEIHRRPGLDPGPSSLVHTTAAEVSGAPDQVRGDDRGTDGLMSVPGGERTLGAAVIFFSVDRHCLTVSTYDKMDFPPPPVRLIAFVDSDPKLIAFNA